MHDDVIKWKHFPRYWSFVQGIHRSPVNIPHKGQWRGALMFSLICAWINCWVNNREAGYLRCHHAHYDVTVMCFLRYLEFSNVKNPCAVISWKHCARKSIIFCWIMYGFIDLNLHLILIQFSDVEHNMIGHITLASITGTNILVPYLKFKWMHLIWWLAFIVLI